MNNFKINARQFAIFVILFSVGSTILIIPGGMAQAAKQDAWIGAVIGTGISLLLVALYITMGRMFPNLTLVEVNEKVFGKWIGKLVSLSLIFFSFYSSALLLTDVGNFLTVQMLAETPIAAIEILFACIVIMGIRLGIETLARTSEILFACFLVLFSILVLLLLPQVELKNIQPIFEAGIKPITRATIFFISFFSLPIVVLLMIFPVLVNQQKKAEKNFYIGILFGGILLICLIILTILVLGADISAAQLYPSYTLARVIKVGDSLQRIEAIMAGIWFITLYFKFVLYFYAAVIGLAKTLKLKDYLPLTLPLGMLLVLLALTINPNTVEADTFNKEVWPLYVASYGLALPILLIGVHTLRKIVQQKKQKQ